LSEKEIKKRKVISRYVVKTAIRKNTEFIVKAKWIGEILSDYKFPNPIEQVEYLIKFLGDNLEYAGKWYVCNLYPNNNRYSYNNSILISSQILISATASINYDNLQGIIVNASSTC
jgi:hypothetical protein